MDVVEWAVGIEPESSLEYTADDGEEDTLSAGEVMYQAYLDGTDPGFGAKSSTLEVSAADGVFVSGVVYLGITARFAVSYAGDLPAPTATVVADGLSCTIVPECRDAEGALVDGVTLAVYRIAYDGESVRIASGMANSGSSACTDWFADMGVSTYRIVVFARLVAAGVHRADAPGQVLRHAGRPERIVVGLDQARSRRPDARPAQVHGRLERPFLRPRAVRRRVLGRCQGIRHR